MAKAVSTVPARVMETVLQVLATILQKTEIFLKGNKIKDQAGFQSMTTTLPVINLAHSATRHDDVGCLLLSTSYTLPL